MSATRSEGPGAISIAVFDHTAYVGCGVRCEEAGAGGGVTRHSPHSRTHSHRRAWRLTHRGAEDAFGANQVKAERVN